MVTPIFLLDEFDKITIVVLIFLGLIFLVCLTSLLYVKYTNQLKQEIREKKVGEREELRTLVTTGGDTYHYTDCLGDDCPY